MDNGPAKKNGVSQKLQTLGEEVGDPFEISTVRREVRLSSFSFLFSISSSCRIMTSFEIRVVQPMYYSAAINQVLHPLVAINIQLRSLHEHQASINMVVTLINHSIIHIWILLEVLVNSRKYLRHVRFQLFVKCFWLMESLDEEFRCLSIL